MDLILYFINRSIITNMNRLSYSRLLQFFFAIFVVCPVKCKILQHKDCPSEYEVLSFIFQCVGGPRFLAHCTHCCRRYDFVRFKNVANISLTPEMCATLS